MTVHEKREVELKTMGEIIGIYCHLQHGKINLFRHMMHRWRGTYKENMQLCEDCEDVWKFSKQRIDRCPYMEEKTFCSMCKTHCYGRYREKVKAMMRFGGPRMLLISPIMVIKHLYYEWQEKRKLKTE